MHQIATRQPAAAYLWRPWMICLLAALLYLIAVFLIHDSNALTFVTLGTRFAEHDPTGAEGYDGQFTYFIARDGWDAAPLLDVPAYRLQRILLPALAAVLSFGNADLLPWLLPALNLAALIAGVYLLESLLIARGVSRWYALIYGLFPGILMAIRLSLSEPWAYGLVLLAIWLRENGRFWLAAVACALATLAKETALIFAAGIVLWELASRRWLAGLTFGLLAILPFVAWQAVLTVRLGTPGLGSGGDLATPFEAIPFNGFLRIYTDTGNLRVFAAFALLLLPTAIGPTLWAIWRTLHDLARGKQALEVFLLLANAAVLPFVPFSTYREPLGMVRMLVGLVVAVLLYGAWQRNRRVLRYSSLWLALLALAVVSG
ncbi:MAG: hypothetical protein HPY64_12465 [Anaerolineae bacterium]|nr:hypothetical protein [Anaerolineae bacterium]